MEMESSRRSIARSREPGLKKPRLIEDSERDRSSNGLIDRVRSFPQRVSTPPTSAPLLSRVRANERDREAERNDSGHGNDQQQQQQQLQHSSQEIVSEYKTALAELTFNSKPIITNLTIIAGENLHAAKWIAGTVCANILEVPSEQKLPSLYLLDSIVKNIGKDYIKYFAAKLPEVFCKAYRQVDASIHPGMRHLFGTWKRVFPPAALQMIEKELGFTPAINVPSSGAQTSRPESQSQPPAHGIHVNPKYLEARQRQQQSDRAKDDDSAGAMVAPVDDATMPERTAIIGRGRPWADLPAKHDINEPVHEKKTGVGYEDNQYDSDLLRHSDLEVGRASGRVTERGLGKSWYGAGGNAADATVSQRNAYNSEHGFANHRKPKSSQAIAQLQPTQSTANRSSGGMPRNWKNFEEEEYMWDEMNSRVADHGGPDSSRKDGWTPDNAETLEFEDFSQLHSEHNIGSRRKRETPTDSLFMAQRRQAGNQTSSMWPLQDPREVNGLSHKEVPTRFSGPSDGHSTILSGLTSMTSSTSRRLQSLTGPSVGAASTFGSLGNTVSGSGGVFGQQRHPHLRPPSPSGQSSMHQHAHLPLPSPSALNQPQKIRGSSPINPFPQLNKHSRFSQLPHQELAQSDPSGQTQNLLPHPSVFGTPGGTGPSALTHSSNTSADAGQLSRGSLLAANMKSGLPSDKPVSGGFPNLDFQDSHTKIQPPLPSGLPTQSAASSASLVPPASVMELDFHGSTSAPSLTTNPTLPPPLPPGPPPASPAVGSTLIETSAAVPNPLSSLLNTLVVNGLISAPTKESPNITATRMPSQLQDQSSAIATINSAPVSSVTSSIIPSSLSGEELPSSESVAKSIITSSPEIKDLIGFEFKPEIIRESHSLVISALFDDLPHTCSICGLRFKLRELLERHMEWHASKMPEAISCKNVSRRWYMSLADWVSGTTAPTFEPESIKTAESSEPAVAADENQNICLLCGELFEDFYSFERDMWMFKGAIYMGIPAPEAKMGTMDESSAGGLIVHASCISPCSVYDLGLAKNVELDQTGLPIRHCNERNNG